MVNGRVTYDGLINDELSYMDWSPNGKSRLIHIMEGAAGQIPTQVYSLDAATSRETVLTECPAWLDRPFRSPLRCGTGVMVGGKVIGLPSSAQAVITTYDLVTVHLQRAPKNRRNQYGYLATIVEASLWERLRNHHLVEWHLGHPASYVVHVDGTHVYQSSVGRLDPIQPDALDFVLEKQ